MLPRVILVVLCLGAVCVGFVGLRAQAPAAPAASAPPRQTDSPPQAGDAIRRDVNLVDILFTVFDKKNRIVSTLNQEDFRVSDDGQSQRILFFNHQTDLPLRVGLLMDTS